MMNNDKEDNKGCLDLIGKAVITGLFFGVIALITSDLEGALITFICWFIGSIFVFGYEG